MCGRRHQYHGQDRRGRNLATSFVLPGSAGVPPSLDGPSNNPWPPLAAGGIRVPADAKCADPYTAERCGCPGALPSPRCLIPHPLRPAKPWRAPAWLRSGSGGRCVITCPLRSQASALRAARLSCRITHLVTFPVARGRRHRPPHSDRGREAAGHEGERGAPGTPAKERRGRRRGARGAARLFLLIILHCHTPLPLPLAHAHRGPTHLFGPFRVGREGLRFPPQGGLFLGS